MPTQMTYASDGNPEVSIHDHPTDQTCHWVDVFKPLAFTVFRDALLLQKLVESPYFAGKTLNASDPAAYARWLCTFGTNGL